MQKMRYIDADTLVNSNPYMPSPKLSDVTDTICFRFDFGIYTMFVKRV